MSDKQKDIQEDSSPANIGGMGPVTLPNGSELGSGDVPAGKGDAKEEQKKKKKKRKRELEMQEKLVHLTFENFVNEITDYNDPVLIRLRQDKLRRADFAKLDAMKKEAEKNRKKAMKRWSQKKYEKWLEEVASNGGAENAFDMAKNAEFEPGLIDWVEKEFPDNDPMQRIQWDIEAYA